MPTDALRTYLAGRLPHHLAALRRAVEVNSFTENPAGVDAVGDLTAELFAGLGFAAERVASAEPRYGRHLFLSRPAPRGGGPARRVAFVSHLDTVFPPGEEIEH